MISQTWNILIRKGEGKLIKALKTMLTTLMVKYLSINYFFLLFVIKIVRTFIKTG